MAAAAASVDRDAASRAVLDAREAIDSAVETDGGTSSVADAAATPLDAEGPPLMGAKGVWTYTEFPDTQCRDGSPAGVAVNLGTSQELMIYLEGGGWCADEQTCAINPSKASDQIDLLGLTYASGGVFDREDSRNPVRDWNFVYVPYCTGDLFSGANPNGDVPGVGPQKFMGRPNMGSFLRRIVTTFSQADNVLLTGSSAGGMGAFLNAPLVQHAFANRKIKMIADSGPLLSKALNPECLQEKQRVLWKLDDTILVDCGAACPNKNDYALDFALFVASALRDRPSGLIESTGDWMIRAIFSTGNGDCTGTFDLLDPGISSVALRSELLSFREKVTPFENFATFMPDDEAHTWLWIAVPGFTGDFYEGSAGGMKLVDWFGRILAGESPGHVGP
jgi:hypothetical protein